MCVRKVYQSNRNVPINTYGMIRSGEFGRIEIGILLKIRHGGCVKFFLSDKLRLIRTAKDLKLSPIFKKPKLRIFDTGYITERGQVRYKIYCLHTEINDFWKCEQNKRRIGTNNAIRGNYSQNGTASTTIRYCGFSGWKANNPRTSTVLSNKKKRFHTHQSTIPKFHFSMLPLLSVSTRKWHMPGGVKSLIDGLDVMSWAGVSFKSHAVMARSYRISRHLLPFFNNSMNKIVTGSRAP